jgi:hypothetical protein
MHIPEVWKSMSCISSLWPCRLDLLSVTMRDSGIMHIPEVWKYELHIIPVAMPAGPAFRHDHDVLCSVLPPWSWRFASCIWRSLEFICYICGCRLLMFILRLPAIIYTQQSAVPHGFHAQGSTIGKQYYLWWREPQLGRGYIMRSNSNTIVSAVYTVYAPVSFK